MKHELYPADRMLESHNVTTICEQLRLAYRGVCDGRTEIPLYHLRIAMTMAKKMDKKLRKYNKSWDRDFFTVEQ